MTTYAKVLAPERHVWGTLRAHVIEVHPRSLATTLGTFHWRDGAWRHCLDANVLLEFEAPAGEGEDCYADADCPGCGGGDKVPFDADYWRCPTCDAEWFEEGVVVDPNPDA